MPTRNAGLRGRLPKKPPAERFNIQYLSSYLTSPLPAPAYPVDVTAGITDWQMLGNGPDPTCTTHPNGVGTARSPAASTTGWRRPPPRTRPRPGSPRTTWLRST